MFNRIILFLICLPLLPSYSLGQRIISGTNDYIEYHKGSLPIVISVAHGGYLNPSTIPDRTCGNAVYATDAYTIELAKEIDSAFFRRTGCFPHIIYCNLRRSKVDCNRNESDGACGNAEAVKAWKEFHQFIRDARLQAETEFPEQVLYLDLHGHGNSIQRIELGYLLYDTELELTDQTLNGSSYVNNSSLRRLVSNNLNNHTHAQLLRGEKAFGTMLHEKGYPSVPSFQIPSPGTNTNYYSGGYNIATHSSYATGVKANGVQMECNYTGIRDNQSNRERFADSLALVVLDYLEFHRNANVTNCNKEVSIKTTKDGKFKVYPNPIHQSQEFLLAEGLKHPFDFTIYNIAGFAVLKGTSQGERMDIKGLSQGIYFLKIQQDNSIYSFKIIVQ
jgi:hypothetical protein